MRTRTTTSILIALLFSFGVGSAAVPQAAAESATRFAGQESDRGPTYTAQQRRVVALVNATRRAHGRRGVTLHPMLTVKAQQWAEHLARIDRLVHSDLTDGAPANWLDLAENVGRGRTIAIVHRALLNQPQHREIILDRFNRIGTGVATSASGRVYVVQVFMRV